MVEQALVKRGDLSGFYSKASMFRSFEADISGVPWCRIQWVSCGISTKVNRERSFSKALELQAAPELPLTFFRELQLQQKLCLLVYLSWLVVVCLWASFSLHLPLALDLSSYLPSLGHQSNTPLGVPPS